MRKTTFWILIPAFLFLTVNLLPSNNVAARPVQVPSYASAFELIVAVNDLRASYGLPAYNVSSILMGTAQGQAEFMASTGTVTHSGPGGISLTDRLINAGYSMAGGFRAENILSTSPDASGYEIVNSGYWADSDHQNTMLSPNLSEIGAGVAVAGGRGYYVIDCAQPSGAQLPPSSGSGTSSTQGPSQIMAAVVLSTPREDGAVIHEVQYGQSLWSIAIAYETKIDEIKRLNGLTSNEIYLGQKLLVKVVGTATPTVPVPTETPTTIPLTKTPTHVPTSAVATMTPSAEIKSQSTSTSGGGWVTGVIILAALLAAGIGTWLGMRKPL